MDSGYLGFMYSKMGKLNGSQCIFIWTPNNFIFIISMLELLCMNNYT